MVYITKTLLIKKHKKSKILKILYKLNYKFESKKRLSHEKF